MTIMRTLTKALLMAGAVYVAACNSKPVPNDNSPSFGPVSDFTTTCFVEGMEDDGGNIARPAYDYRNGSFPSNVSSYQVESKFSEKHNAGLNGAPLDSLDLTVRDRTGRVVYAGTHVYTYPWFHEQGYPKTSALALSGDELEGFRGKNYNARVKSFAYEMWQCNSKQKAIAGELDKH